MCPKTHHFTIPARWNFPAISGPGVSQLGRDSPGQGGQKSAFFNGNTRVFCFFLKASPENNPTQKHSQSSFNEWNLKGLLLYC